MSVTNSPFAMFALLCALLCIIFGAIMGVSLLAKEVQAAENSSAWLWSVGDLNDHAVERHSASATAVSECIKNSGTVDKLSNPQTGREAYICKLGESKFGVWIGDCNEKCVTAFIKDKMQSLEDVIRYLSNAGYVK
jgi:hypothetical protein